jgi:hypothetical protein
MRWTLKQRRATCHPISGEMIGLAHWMEPSPLGRALRPLIAPDGHPLGMSFTSGAYAAMVSVMTSSQVGISFVIASHPVGA